MKVVNIRDPRTTVPAIETLEMRRMLADASVFLSDLQPAITPTNGWGPIEKDHSNGESGANDGHTVTLDGQTYAKGLGVHANSEVGFDIQATSQFTNFFADIGVDDEVGASGSVTFQVWLGNTKVYDSNGVMTGTSATQSLNIDVTGFTGRLRLIVTNGGNGNTFDHADWANARLFGPEMPPSVTVQRTSGGNITENGGVAGFNFNRLGQTANPLIINFNSFGTATRGADYVLHLGDGSGPVFTGNTLTFPAGAASVLITATTIDDAILDPSEDLFIGVASGAGYTVGSPNLQSTVIEDNDQNIGFTYLSDLPYNTGSNGWGPFEFDRSNGEAGAADGHALTINGQKFSKGIGMHANGSIEYLLNGDYATFNASIGIDDEVGSNGSAIFQVYANNVKVFESGVRTGSQAAQQISVPLNGATLLRLVVLDAGNGNAFDHADWGDATLSLPDNRPSVSAEFDSGSPLKESGGAAIYRFTRDTISANPLTVNFTVAGTATRGVDYVLRDGNDVLLNGTSVVIPANQASGYVKIIPIHDSFYDPDEDVHISLTSGAGYVTSGLATPSVVIVDDGPTPTFLSDLDPTSASNGWGPFERNRTNGEAAANDGNRIMRLNGVEYNTGLGVHATSDLLYNITGSGKSHFRTAAGVDDEVGNNGSVIFRVYVNDQIKFDSGLMTGSSATQLIDVDISGATNLRLIVTDGGNGNVFDHADWANAWLE